MEELGTIVNSTKAKLEEFKESIIWSDFVRELNEWIKGFEIERARIVDDAADTNPSTATILMRLGDINGRIKAAEYMKELPDVFIKIINERKELKKLQSEDN